jgi:hypothetical protein
LTARQLRLVENWRVRSKTLNTDYSFAPPTGNAEVATHVGRHAKCLDFSLSKESTALARLPHVGVVLTPKRATSCLESWNLTLVFEAKTKPPTLSAAVYDQWEW